MGEHLPGAPPNSHVAVLTPGASECAFVWRWGLCYGLNVGVSPGALVLKTWSLGGTIRRWGFRRGLWVTVLILCFLFVI